MEHFYDGQIRRFVTQFIRAFSNFSYKDGAGTLRKIPVSYGNLTRQVANIIRDNSENKVMSAPRIACYITGLEYARDRVQSPTHVDKIHVRHREYDDATGTYKDLQGVGNTIERLMPVPFTLRMKADIWSTNTDQKLQIMEQILVLYNPALEIQTTNNYVDWTSLSLIELASVNYSTRSIPQGTETEIDIGEMEFQMPIWVTPPAKVKKLGVIEKIIMNIFDESGSVSDGIIDATIPTATIVRSPGDYKLLVLNNTARLLHAHEGVEESKTGTFTRTGDDTQMVLSIDSDTVPENSVLTDSVNTRGTIDAIIDPTTFAPDYSSITAGTRYLILNNINPNVKGDSSDANANAWQNADGSVFKANQNDIITWNGSFWEITLDSSATNDGADSAASPAPVYITNTYTGIQYKWENASWLKSFEGEYEADEWRLVL